jgi:anthranilate phosphoribosyltransferase
MKDLLVKIIGGTDLTADEAAECMDFMLSGEATTAQIAGFLTALRMKGETIDEVIGCTRMMQDKACHISPSVSNYIDFVGTGGDGTNTFNISTTSSLVAAGAGVAVAKHGNRASSSKSGSSDVLEALGVNIMIEPEMVQHCVEEIGIGFMNAQTFHKLMKNVATVRRELGIRTIFNILGPLSNPSGAKSQVIGVFDGKMAPVFANVMKQLGVERAFVIHGHDGMDEITTTGKTLICEIKDGEILQYDIDPKEYGIPYAKPDDLLGGDAKENARIALEILTGQIGPKRDIVAFNAGAAIYVAGKADSLADGIEKAKETIDSGKAYQKLQELISLTQKLGAGK